MLSWYLPRPSGFVCVCANICKNQLRQTMRSKSNKRPHQTEDQTDGNVVEDPKKQKLQQHGHWAKGLLTAMEDPNLKVEDDELVVVINDKYPKAECHYLVIPKESIASLKELNETHISLLKHMHKVAKKLAKAQPNRVFKIGFHAHASMTQLHLHVISDDFNSPSLKTKKHWNSFTTEFLLPYEDVKSEIKTNGKFTEKPEAELKSLLLRDLKCHKCDYVSKTIPTLKNHVRITHFQTITTTRENKDNHIIFDN